MKYELPKLGYESLEPYISDEQLRTHHEKHHAAYVKGANSVLEKLENARKNNEDIDMKSTLKTLSFHIGGHMLHSLFWKNMSPNGGKISGKIEEAINKEFGSLEQFKKEFAACAMSLEGSGWAILVQGRETGKLVLMQVEKHNVNMYPDVNILLVLDMWEHAFYIDHKNEKGKFLEAFWNVINWDEVEKRLQ